MTKAKKAQAPAQPQLVLENIHTRESWEVLKKIVHKNRLSREMPPAVLEVFETPALDRLLELTLSPNPTIAALANSRLFYDGDDMNRRTQQDNT